MLTLCMHGMIHRVGWVFIGIRSEAEGEGVGPGRVLMMQVGGWVPESCGTSASVMPHF